MRWMILTLMLLGICGCSNGSTGPRSGLQQSDGGWNAREKSVPGVKSNYGLTEGRQDD